MKILANENFPRASVLFLKSKGYDVKSIGVDSAGISDSEIMEIAITEKRLILTFDSDYGELIFKFGFKPPAGVIYLRLKDFTPEYPGKLIYDIFSNYDLNFNHRLSVIDRNGVRQRSY